MNSLEVTISGKPEDKPLSAQPRKVNSEHIISAAPPLRTIIEQKSVEEREAEAMELQPPSPLQDFMKKHRSHTWPMPHMGYTNGVPDADDVAGRWNVFVPIRLE